MNSADDPGPWLKPVPQGAASLWCSLTLCLVGFFFVVPKDNSSYWLRIFLLVDSASGSEIISIGNGFVQQYFCDSCSAQKEPWGYAQELRTFSYSLYWFGSWPHLCLEQYLQNQLISTLTMAVWSTLPLCSLCTSLSVPFQKFFSQGSALIGGQHVLLLEETTEVLLMYACN